MKRLTLTLALLLLAVPGWGEEESKREEEPRLTAGAWCSLTDSDDEDSDDPGCDAGLGVALHRFDRVEKLSWIAVVGTKTLGTGLAWTARRPSRAGPTIAVAVGVVAPYDEGGVYSDRVSLAVGTTFGWGGGS